MECGGHAELQALFTTVVAAQAKEREGVISLTLLRASLLESNTKEGEVRPIAAICSVGHRVWRNASSLAHLSNACAKSVPVAAVRQVGICS